MRNAKLVTVKLKSLGCLVLYRIQKRGRCDVGFRFDLKGNIGLDWSARIQFELIY